MKKPSLSKLRPSSIPHPAIKIVVLLLMMCGQFGWQPLSVNAASMQGSAAAANRDDAKALAQVAVGDEYLIQIDPALHQKFGLYYPATYKFRLPAGAHDLIAQYRYSDGAWSNLPEKRSGEVFNGIDAVRFDYANGAAYLSARFSLSSDNLYLRVIDSAGAPVSLTFDSIPKYYDDRKGAVAITVDDWNFAFDTAFRTATDYLVSRNFFFTVAVIAADVPWSSVQEKINQHGAFMELASHSLHHPCSASAYQASGYDAETSGSRDAITANLTFPNYPYVPAYIEPCGYSDSSLYSAISSANYIVNRSSNDYFGTASRFIDWDSFQGRYGRAGVTYNDGPAGDTPVLLAEANAAFDRAMAIGGIYSLEDHPYFGYWHDGSYLLQHLDYIKGRADVWYVPFGQMYQYHFLQEMRGNLSIQHLLPATLLASFSAAPVVGNVPLLVTFTDTSIGTVTGWLWDFGDGGTGTGQAPQHTYVTAGSYPVTLTVSGPLGSNSKTEPNYIKVNVPSPATVSITAPVDGASFTAPATIQLAATPSSGGATIGKIDFYAGSHLLGTATAPPYGFTWTNVPPGHYSLTAQETDLSGATAVSAAVSVTVNATVPAAPTITNVAALKGQAEVTFSAPLSDGGSPIASYSVTASPGNIVAIGGSSPIPLAGLANGTAYTFTVSATNAVGAGAASAPVIVAWPPASGTVSSMAPASSTYGPGGGTGQIAVNAIGPWSASTINSWIIISSGSSFASSGTVSYTVSANDTGKPRTGTITVGNLYFTVRQPGGDFSDNTDASAWFYPYINCVYAAGVAKGCGSNSFCTADPVTREQMAAFIIRALNGENFTYTTAPYFTDVPADSWSYRYVQKLKDLGVTTNTGSYEAASYVTREQAAAFIIRALYGENFTYPTTPYFSDVPPSVWSFKYVQKMKEEGLTTNNGTYDPSGMVTRDQMATFISRAFLGVMPSSMEVPSDNTGFRAGLIIGKTFLFPVPELGSVLYTFDENGTFSASSSGAVPGKSYSGSWIINSDGTMTLNNVQGMTPGYVERYTLVGGGGIFPLLVNYLNSNGSSGANIMMTAR